MVLVTLIVSFLACERVQQVIQPVTSDMGDKGNEISIGLVLPLTGHFASTGQIMKQGFDLALDEINKAQRSDISFKYITVDDTSTVEGAVVAFNELIEQNVFAILGPASSSATRAAFPIAKENKIVAISPTSGARGLGAISNFVFRIPLTTDVVIPRGIKTTHAKLGYQRVATMYDKTDLFSTDRNEALQETFDANDIEVLITEVFETGDSNFSDQLARIKALDPDAIFVSALPPNKPGILIQAHELGISVPIFMSSLTDVEVQAAGAAAEGVITFTGWLNTDDTPGNQAFVQQNYNDTYGMKPSGFVAVSYASVYILAEALKNAQSIDPISIRDALKNIKDFDTILGKFSFNTDGDAIYEPNVLIVRNGTLQPFFE